MVSLRCFAFFDKCYGMYRISSFFENKKKFYSSLMDFIFIFYFFFVALSTINTIPHPPLSLTPKIIKKRKKKRKKGGTYARVCCGKRDEEWRGKGGKEGKIIKKGKKKKRKTEEKNRQKAADRNVTSLHIHSPLFLLLFFFFLSFNNIYFLLKRSFPSAHPHLGH
ncbi:hypothetical protein, unlikely [Trypanosoma brucei brucei TREU927]|uniref:Uncharacterized protein n=1 Tax=Trypanosoma brucei brucei (strain 927/4 GUTat10.1) TaxID=185431 RepID=Q4GZ93_TRYB2|nr:hypothetical protein, unlikely [Trypanosoma brucei brucei TREU927]CAJ16074.1 hypothetical protein, unlikely [Trypanosoma brucei brucei TREU927]